MGRDLENTKEPESNRRPCAVALWHLPNGEELLSIFPNNTFILSRYLYMIIALLENLIPFEFVYTDSTTYNGEIK